MTVRQIEAPGKKPIEITVNGARHEPGTDTGTLFGAIVLCGGRGTRLHAETGDKIHKSLYVPEGSGGRELITYTIEMLNPKLVDTIAFAIDHHADQIRRWVHEAALPHEIVFIHAPNTGIPLKIADGLAVLDKEHVVVCNADEIRGNFSLREMMDHHLRSGMEFTATVTDPRNAVGNSILFLVENGTITEVARRQDVPKTELESEKWLQHSGVMIIRRDGVKRLNIEAEDWDPGVTKPAVGAGVISLHVARDVNFYNVNSSAEVREVSRYLSTLRRKETNGSEEHSGNGKGT